jgi:hypothetical protein
LPKSDEKSVLLSYVEPKPPNMLETALVVDGHRKDTNEETAVTQNPPDKAAADELPSQAPTQKAKARLEVFLTSRRKVSGTHGHASDYSWLQGILERGPTGGVDLIYSRVRVGKEDAWGGRVHLQNDDRLAIFQVGDIVLVEGELLFQQAGGGAGASTPPFYVVHQIWAVRQAD